MEMAVTQLYAIPKKANAAFIQNGLDRSYTGSSDTAPITPARFCFADTSRFLISQREPFRICGKALFGASGKPVQRLSQLLMYGVYTPNLKRP